MMKLITVKLNDFDSPIIAQMIVDEDDVTSYVQRIHNAQGENENEDEDDCAIKIEVTDPMTIEETLFAVKEILS